VKGFRTWLETHWNIFLNAVRNKTRCWGIARSSNEKAVAGVCAGLSRKFGWNITIVRCAFVFVISFGLAAAVVYGICWMAFDERPTQPR